MIVVMGHLWKEGFCSLWVLHTQRYVNVISCFSFSHHSGTVRGPIPPCLTCAYPWLHWALLTYLLQSSHFIPFLVSKLWFSLHTSSCFDIRFASQDFKIPDFKLLNRASEWLSLRKCWNMVSYFNRHVIQNTPPAVAALVHIRWFREALPLTDYLA